MKNPVPFVMSLKKQSKCLDGLIQKLEIKNQLDAADFRLYDDVTIEVEKSLKILRKTLSK